MAEPLPPALRTPDISRFINRANQLRAVKPAIAYWCEYHAVNQIVGKALHTADDDCFAFTRTLLERLEATKAERAADDAIADNAAGQAYVEQFAAETFARAERTLRAGRVTRQTADTFDAAATFFDLTREWGPPDAETLQKIKFAKWNAARILRAIREGKDPNESNPRQPEPEPDDGGLRLLDAAAASSDPEVQAIMNPPPPPPTVEDVADTGEPSAPPPHAPEEEYSAPPVGPGSPFAHAPASTGPPAPPQPSPPSQRAPPPAAAPQPSAPAPPAAWAAAPPAPAQAAAPAPTAAPAPAPATMHYKDISQAQKHAKWAISALNFEDIPTAIQELRNALAMLGAQ